MKRMMTVRKRVMIPKMTTKMNLGLKTGKMWIATMRTTALEIFRLENNCWTNKMDIFQILPQGSFGLTVGRKHNAKCEKHSSAKCFWYLNSLLYLIKF